MIEYDFEHLLAQHRKWADGDDRGKRADLSNQDLSGMDFSGAFLREANLNGAILSGTNFAGANLFGADISDTCLRGADLTGANIVGASLSGSDISGVTGLPDAPVVVDLDWRIADAITDKCLGDALEMQVWHSFCGTAHCRAGWAITLAGNEGKDLELRYGPSVAGALVYYASTGRGQIPNWRQSNREAMDDITGQVTSE
jgi:uncharacterized protein YjbI with pentapeptide repeats